MSTDKELKVVFAPGCFDDFEGTQDELNDLVAQIKNLAASGELFNESSPVELDDVDDETLAKIQEAFNNPRH